MEVITVCVSGNTATNEQDNIGKIEILQNVTNRIQHYKWSPTVILFPGGFFHLPCHVGQMVHENRVFRLNQQQFSTACCEMAHMLNTTVVAGVDSIPQQNNENHQDDADQLCVAWNSTDITGIGRKVFPTKDEANTLIIYARDMISKQRLAPVGDCNRALLCACYDMFGCAENEATGPRGGNIRLFDNGNNGLLNRATHRRDTIANIRHNLPGWGQLVNQASVGLAAIHHFTRRRRGSGKSYWQRHGLQNASNFLGGGVALGAAHFEALPKDHNVAVLAASGGQKLNPTQFFNLENKAMVRLFDVNLRQIS
jgi:hypothetical protein